MDGFDRTGKPGALETGVLSIRRWSIVTDTVKHLSGNVNEEII
jgi:hypothetical protein